LRLIGEDADTGGVSSSENLKPRMLPKMLLLDNESDGLELTAGEPGVGEGGFDSKLDCPVESKCVRTGFGGASFAESKLP